ncbi:hypothetical protein C490_04967 [Natronobacterium gregoryi SP2]|uniref:Uncharacterized protein n=1 Tax=Natronobacterium gregoryi (strain ATCC 43098 / DSM 3393 / CCM 3738 / CIP 104747 / IAM 13177 / JCM 8860 / NBRC 102187 / NCIMB 2189 / SP2) TaxID=797304 RepID=L9YBX5_NATGS|nr:hypothetical protein C490_04967 [Natronobacterium gregoryi SP2]
MDNPGLVFLLVDRSDDDLIAVRVVRDVKRVAAVPGGCKLVVVPVVGTRGRSLDRALVNRMTA